MNLHQRGQRLLNRVTRSETGTGVSVLYTRGATTAPLVVTPSVEDLDATTQPSPTARNLDRERDYLIVLADIVSAGFGVPADGDRITETLNGVAETFEVTARRTEPAWRWADAQRTRVRVHTIRKVLA